MPSAAEPPTVRKIDVFDHPGTSSLLASIDALQVGAIALLVLALGAIGAACAVAYRGPGGWRAVFGLGAARGSTRHGLDADELRSVMAQADQMAEEIAGELDAKAARLESLIHEADIRLARLAGPGAESADGDERVRRERGGEGASVRGGARAPVTGRDGGGVGSGGGGQNEQATVTIHEDPITLEIYRLADTGLSPLEIARKLGQHTGKVELIIALRQ